METDDRWSWQGADVLEVAPPYEYRGEFRLTRNDVARIHSIVDPKDAPNIVRKTHLNPFRVDECPVPVTLLIQGIEFIAPIGRTIELVIENDEEKLVDGNLVIGGWLSLDEYLHEMEHRIELFVNRRVEEMRAMKALGFTIDRFNQVSIELDSCRIEMIHTHMGTIDSDTLIPIILASLIKDDQFVYRLCAVTRDATIAVSSFIQMLPSRTEIWGILPSIVREHVVRTDVSTVNTYDVTHSPGS